MTDSSHTLEPSDPKPLRHQRGSVMIIVVTILAALLAGGGIVMYTQVMSTRAAGLIRANRSALYCAEAGLASARTLIGQNAQLWNNLLDADTLNDPPWYPVRGDLDIPADGDDFEVTVRDNNDEPPGLDDPTKDNDQQVFIVSRCIKYPSAPRSVMELVQFPGSGSVYRAQAGQGAGATGNTN